MAKRYQHEFETNNIGPFQPFIATLTSHGENRLLVYGNNGVGKTCLSRVFALADSHTPSPAECATVLKAGSNKGKFHYKNASFKDGIETVEDEFTIELKSNGEIQVQHEGDFIYHVFNSDYVHDNVWAQDAGLEGSIMGYVVSRQQIQTDREETELKQVTDKGIALKDELQRKLDAEKDRIKEKYGIGNTLREFTAITLKSVEALEAAPDGYDEAVAKLVKLDEMADSEPDIGLETPPFAVYSPDSSIAILGRSYTASSLADEYKQKLQKWRPFYQFGLQAFDEEPNVCPFCQQELTNIAINAIDGYKEYFKDETTKADTDLERECNNIETLKEAYSAWLKKYKAANERYASLAANFQKIKEKSLPTLPTEEEYKECADAALSLLQDKRNNLADEFPPDNLSAFAAMSNLINTKYQEAIALINGLKHAAASITRTKTEARKALCIEASKRFKNNHLDDFTELQNLRLQASELQARIKEASPQTDKRELVANQLSKLFELVFDDKYQFDPETFRISFPSSELPAGVSRVLSSGEQAIIAFCYFLASAITNIEEMQDWKRVFYVIDDPISSMDFNYVYQVSHFIKHINEYTGCELDDAPVRLIGFTHNAEFFNILVMNNVFKNACILNSEGMTQTKKRAVLPYEEHLRDIYRVFKGEVEFSHTTGNSIRHVLESLWHFYQPKLEGLGAYIQTEPIIADDPFITMYCNDQSHEHGMMNMPFNGEMVHNACGAVLALINERMPGQYEYIEVLCSQ